jgi:CubicO group peptidase (beta-lactamase class C family)
MSSTGDKGVLNIRALEQRIEDVMRRGCIPGLALALIKDADIIYARGFGVTSVEDGGLTCHPTNTLSSWL